MITSSGDILTLVVAALRFPDATGAGARVYRPGDWPTQGGQYPILKLRVPRESKQSVARGGPPEFTVTTTIRIVGEVSAPAEVNDAGAAVAEAALWALARQVEVAVIGSYPLEQQIQQFASVDSQLAFNSDAETHLAGIQIDLAVEWYQGPESFAPIIAEDLAVLDLDASQLGPTGLSIPLS